MNELLQVIAELGLELHPDRIKSIANKIELLQSAQEFALAKPSFGPNINQELVERLDRAWKKSEKTTPIQLASALRGASAAAVLSESNRHVELVWTGPSTAFMPVRHTEQVLCEVIETAQDNIFFVSFVVYEVDSVIKALQGAAELQVQINVLFEPSKEHGGMVNIDSIKVISDSVPSANIYRWEPEAKKVVSGGSIHAKCIVADNKIAFITSANLSAAAMERNMELGVLFRGGHIPNDLNLHLTSLIDTGIIIKVSP